MRKWGLRNCTIGSRISDVSICYRNLCRIKKKAVNINDITAYDFHLMRNNMTEYAESSLRLMLYGFGLFLEYFTGKNPCIQARLRWNGIETDKVWITGDEWSRLFDAADPMMRLVLALGGSMGLRRTEILTIKMSDISGNLLRVVGKGTGNGKIVTMEMSYPVTECLKPYLEWRNGIVTKYGDRSGGNLLICPVKTNLGKPLSPTMLNQMLCDLSDRTGIKWTLHSLRRLFCMTQIDNGVDLETTSKMMRHSSKETTVNSYIKADPRKLHLALAAVNNTFSAMAI